MENSFTRIENIILQHGNRGIETVKQALADGYCKRAAELVIKNKGTVLIGTGFPAAGSFENDGPIGAIALYKVLKTLGYNPVFVFAPPILYALKQHYKTFEFPALPVDESRPLAKKALTELSPSLIISIEKAGIAEDGKYYSMRKKEITSLVAKYDLFFDLCTCPTIAVGDGGNEIGMGNVKDNLNKLPIIPSVTKCTELVIATVSNWGAYGIIAALSLLLQKNLFVHFDAVDIMDFLLDNGSVDGVNHLKNYTEDGLPFETGLSVIAELKNIVNNNLSTLN